LKRRTLTLPYLTEMIYKKKEKTRQKKEEVEDTLLTREMGKAPREAREGKKPRGKIAQFQQKEISSLSEGTQKQIEPRRLSRGYEKKKLLDD